MGKRKMSTKFLTRRVLLEKHCIRVVTIMRVNSINGKLWYNDFIRTSFFVKDNYIMSHIDPDMYLVVKGPFAGLHISKKHCIAYAY
jgi:hypothetical protein